MTPSSLPTDLVEFLQHEVDCGNYASADGVVAEGLRLLRERKLYELRRAIDEGLDEIARGDGIRVEGDDALREFFEEIKRGGRQRLQAQRAGQ